MLTFWLLLLHSEQSVQEAPPELERGPFIGKRKRREEKDLNDLQLFLNKFLESVS